MGVNLSLKIILPHSVSGHWVSKSSYFTARTSHCQDPGPASRWCLCIYCTHTLCGYRGHKSVNQSIQWPTSSSMCLEVKGFIPMCGILNCLSLIFISEKYFVDRLLPLQRPTSNKTSFIVEKLHSVRAFFWLQQAIFSLNFSFQQFYLMCFTVSLTFINQRGWKPAHGRNGFAPETSEGQFWLCSELCGVGLGSRMDNTVISLKPAIKCCFLLHEPGNTFYTACTNNCSGLCFPDCSTALGLLFCCYCHGRN